MARNWRVLDLSTFRGKFLYDKRARKLVVVSKETGEETLVGLGDVNVMFVGIGVEFGAGVLFHLASEDVVTVMCDWKGMPVSSVYPWTDAHGRVAARQRAQATISVPRIKNAWMRVVKAKIHGQANNLRCHGISGATQLDQMACEVRSGDPSNIEGRAARFYWQCLFGKQGFRRIPGSRNDPINSMLDYGYSVLRGHSVRAVIAAGLTPALGLHHKGRSNAFALADDLIESFRPAVDDAVVTLGSTASLADKNVKKFLVGVTVNSFGCDDRCTATVMIDFGQKYGEYVEEDSGFLDVPIWKKENHES